MNIQALLARILVGILILGLFGPISTAQEKEPEGDYGPLLKVLPQSKHTLADGIRQATNATEVPISAKFELDHNGKLSLSVYTAEKGLTTDAEHNILKEMSGSPEAAAWNPQVEVFQDPEHLKRAAEQQTLMALSKLSLLDVIAKAQKQQRGTVFSVTPVVIGHQPRFNVLVANNGRVATLAYDLSGNIVRSQK
jgi:hypothetical protein